MSTKVIVVLDGASGAGKSTIIDFVHREYADRVAVVRKFTNRPRRRNEGNRDSCFVETLPAEVEYVYESVGWRYGISASEIERAHAAGLAAIVTCTDLTTLKALRRQHNGVIVYVYRCQGGQSIRSVLKERGGGTESREDRLREQEVELALSCYAQRLGIYDHVIINAGGKEELFSQVAALLLHRGIQKSHFVARP